MEQVNKVAAEVAEAEFARMCLAHRVETDPAELTLPERINLAGLKTAILSAMKRGLVVVNEAGSPVLTPPGGQSMTFKQATGATWISMDSGEGLNARYFAAICDLTGVQRTDIAKMHAKDYQLCKAIAELFL